MPKKIIITLITISLLFCCSAAWNALIFNADSIVVSHSECGMGNTADSSDDETIITHLMVLIQKINIIIYFVIISIITSLLLITKKQKNYFNIIRDKYGGFRVFIYFIRLFKLGILNPKLF
jgi:hypothetical protein